MKDFNPTNKSDVENFFREQNAERFRNDPNIQFLHAKGYKMDGCFGCDCKTECRAMKRADKMVKEICTPKDRILMYKSYEIDQANKELLIDYTIIGNKEYLGTMPFDLQDFYRWASDGCVDKSQWTILEDLDRDDIDPSGTGRQEVFNVEAYVKHFEGTLVKEFFNLNK